MFDPDFEDVYVGREAVRQALEDGKLVQGLHYYGIPSAWRTDGGYRCVLLQYRTVTEDCTLPTAEDAAEWWEAMAAATWG